MAEKHRKGAGRPKAKGVWKKGNVDLYENLFAKHNHNLFAKHNHNLFAKHNPNKHKGSEFRMIVNCDNGKLTNVYKKDSSGVYYWEGEETPYSSLTANQLANLLPILNDNCFVEAQTDKGLQEVFDGKRTAKVRNIGILVYILKRLAERDLICADWQLQAERQKMFVSARNTPIKAKKLASYLSRFMEQVEAYDSVYSQDDIPPTYKAKMRLKSEIDDLTTSL